MSVKEGATKRIAITVKVDPNLDRLDSGRIGAANMAKLKKHKTTILAAVAKRRSGGADRNPLDRLTD